MFSRALRVLFGFVAACVVAALVEVMFVRPPLVLLDQSQDAILAGLPRFLLLMLAIATHMAAFSAPLALAGVVVGEVWRLRGWLYYVLVGLAVAAIGFYLVFSGQSAGGPTILNTYAAAAFASSGFAGGLTYWLLAGRHAGGQRPPATIVVAPAAAEPLLKVRTADEDIERDPFTIERSTTSPVSNRLVADEKLMRADFLKIAQRLGVKPSKARKIGFVAARQAEDEEEVVTTWNGDETTNTALPGDWIVTNMSPDKEVLKDDDGQTNTYVIEAETFETLYAPVAVESEHGKIFKARSTVDAIFLSGGFEILAPWGETQKADKGYLIMNGKDIYGNNAETFEATYEILS